MNKINLNKKFLFSLFIIIGICFIILLQSSAPPPPSDSMEQVPPIALRYWVQKLSDPNSQRNMIMRIEFAEDERLEEKVDIYYDAANSITFHDDGVAPDIYAGDHIYSAYMLENINAFVSMLTSLQSNLTAQITANGSFLNFKGHAGEQIAELPVFDLDKFNSYLEVEVSALLIDGADCETALLKQNSLFITDLSVVEDPARTYNIVDNTGNPTGVWTFGQMMKNVRNSSTSGATRDFLKGWVKQWTMQQTINGQIVDPRRDVYQFLILPWLRKVYNNYSSGFIDTTNWETRWDNAGENDILKYAPFKLTAIVNRQDLRGSAAYTSTMANGGETRFIYSLIIVDENDGLGTPGTSPFNLTGGPAPLQKSDWQGMNVILEYSNVQTDICEMRDFAQVWLDLSAYSFSDPDLNDALEQITNIVTAANAMPVRPNGSALARIRTNERIFFPSSFASFVSWPDSDWELRQFELNSNGLLEGAPVTNTPVSTANYDERTAFGIETFKSLSNTSDVNGFIEWVYNPFNRLRVALGTHNLPVTYPGTSIPFLAATAMVRAEQMHQWDFDWQASTTHYDVSNLPTVPGLPQYDKNLRRQVSLNTCQGCHSGETKTVFTQVRPLGYGESANYWGTVPDYTENGGADFRFTVNNGKTTEPNVPAGWVENYPETPFSGVSNGLLVNVSAFLTGRNYTGTSTSGITTFEDDELDNVLDKGDTVLGKGEFYVNDPTNDMTNTFPLPEMKWGYNDLEMRKMRMCELLQLTCLNGVRVFPIIEAVSWQPFAYGSH